MFSQQHYVAIAKALQPMRASAIEAQAVNNTDYANGINDTIEKITIILRQDNPKFDQARFTKALNNK